MNTKCIYLLFLSFFIFNFSNSEEWIEPNGKNVKTVYDQGMNASQTQAAKYMGSRGFISPSTLEHVSTDKSIDIINDVWVKPEIDEVIPGALNRKWMALLLQPRLLLPNVWRKTHEFVSSWANHFYGIKVLRSANSDPNQTIGSHSLIVSKINVAQDGDLESHQRRMESFCDECQDSDAILTGVSRGAATTFQAAARYNKSQREKLERVKLIHLEGCFDSVEHVMRSRHPWLLKSNFGMNVMAKCASWIIAFKREGTSPIKVVADFPQHIPVAFISSKKDREVPAVCTKTLIKALLEAGHQNVYYLELDNSRHPNYMSDDENDKIKYQNFMHALYKHHGLPYIPDFATAGKDLVEKAKLQSVFAV
ncbi:hypothetical protein BH09DEP1_BH09DEP1_3570 [soil metagenome]